MKRQKTKKKTAKSGAIRTRPARSAYASSLNSGPRDADVIADIDAAVRQGEAIRSGIERRIEERLVGY